MAKLLLVVILLAVISVAVYMIYRQVTVERYRVDKTRGDTWFEKVKSYVVSKNRLLVFVTKVAKQFYKMNGILLIGIRITLLCSG